MRAPGCEGDQRCPGLGLRQPANRSARFAGCGDAAPFHTHPRAGCRCSPSRWCAGELEGSEVLLPVSARLGCHGEGRSGGNCDSSRAGGCLQAFWGERWCEHSVPRPLSGNRAGGLSPRALRGCRRQRGSGSGTVLLAGTPPGLGHGAWGRWVLGDAGAGHGSAPPPLGDGDGDMPRLSSLADSDTGASLCFLPLTALSRSCSRPAGGLHAGSG